MVRQRLPGSLFVVKFMNPVDEHFTDVRHVVAQTISDVIISYPHAFSVVKEDSEVIILSQQGHADFPLWIGTGKTG